jgi:acyl-CoA synthetase (AMP-forming)/AMP-acid ligase II
VKQVAVVGRPAPVIGELGVACVIPVDGSAPPTLAELRAHVAGDLADYKAPDELLIVDELPLTVMLKPDRLALADLITLRDEDIARRQPTRG